MNKKFKVLQISGFSGLLILGAVVFCLIAGFIGFPVMLVTLGWNALLSGIFGLPSMNLIQGTILWSIICISFYLISKNKFCIRMTTEEDMMQDDEFLKILSDNAKTQVNHQKIADSISKDLIKDIIENKEEEIKK